MNNNKMGCSTIKTLCVVSTGAKEARLIPILYTPCVIPLTMRFIYHLDYTRDDFRMYFWDKLTEALGYTKKIEDSALPDKQVDDEQSAGMNKMPDPADVKVAGTHKPAAATNDTSVTNNKKSSAITKQSAATKQQSARSGKQPATHVTDMPSYATNQHSVVTITNKRSADINKQTADTGKKTAATAGKRTWLRRFFQRPSF